MGSQDSETYQVVNEQYRNLKVQLGKMAAARTEICLEGYLQVWRADEKTARILYTLPTQEQQKNFRVADQLAGLDALPKEQWVAVLERCKNEFCRVAVYGRMTDETTIAVTAVALHQTTVPPPEDE
jgi:hypothetical protein